MAQVRLPLAYYEERTLQEEVVVICWKPLLDVLVTVQIFEGIPALIR